MQEIGLPLTEAGLHLPDFAIISVMTLFEAFADPIGIASLGVRAHVTVAIALLLVS
jgi:hypothetical protein